jgi:hypothetical protein
MEEKRKKQRGNKGKGQRYLKCKHSQYFRSTRSENAEKAVNKNDIHNEATAENSETKYCNCWRNFLCKQLRSSLHTTKKDYGIEYVSCRNWLHEICSPYPDKYIDRGGKLLREKNSKVQERV